MAEHTPLPPKFVLDVHLGKLARHLRMLGFDSLWHPDYQDDVLERTATEEGRVLLTRDRELHERTLLHTRGQTRAGSHYVQAIEPSEQLLEVLKTFSLVERVRSGQGFLTRCLECNSPILPTKAHHLTDRLPEHVLEQHQEFFLCPRCERIYWKGTHWDRMHEWVRKLIK